MKSIVFATNNSHKLSELRHKLEGKFEIKSLNEIGFAEDIPETGKTLNENASIKSNFIFKRFSLNCFSDDTGLEIEALGNRPGVFSARYAGIESDSEKNIDKVLLELKHQINRNARFKTVFSLIIDGNEYFFEGEVKGKIIHERKGASGFGYDPIFVPDGYHQTFAEMNISLKNQISHRAKAAEKLINFLRSL